MAVVAPTTAVIAAMIPVLFAFAIGERLRPLKGFPGVVWEGSGKKKLTDTSGPF